MNDRVALNAARNQDERLAAFLDTLPEDCPVEVLDEIHDLDTALRVAIERRATAKILDKTHRTVETAAAYQSAKDEFAAVDNRQRRFHKHLSEQLSSGVPLTVPRRNAPRPPVVKAVSARPPVGQKPRSRPRTPSPTSTPVGAPITDEEARQLVETAALELARLERRIAAIETAAQAPLDQVDTGMLIGDLNRFIESARKRTQANPSETNQRELSSLVGLRSRIKAARNQYERYRDADTEDEYAFEAPSWRRRLELSEPDKAKKLTRLEADFERTRTRHAALVKQFERERDGHRTQPTGKAVKPAKKRGRGPGRRFTGAPTPEMRAKGLINAGRTRVDKHLWAPIVVWQADESDAALARRIMDRINPDPQTSGEVSYRPGEKFYCIQPGIHNSPRMAIKRFVTADLSRNEVRRIDAAASAAARDKVHRDTVALPQTLAAAGVSLLWFVVALPGTKRWVVAESHLDDLKDVLARHCPFKVVEFTEPGWPVFCKPDRHGRPGKYGTPLEMAVTETDLARVPRTADGNPSFSGMSNANLGQALAFGDARLWRLPNPELVTKLESQLAAARKKIDDTADERLLELTARYARSAETAAAGTSARHRALTVAAWKTMVMPWGPVSAPTVGEWFGPAEGDRVRRKAEELEAARRAKVTEVAKSETDAAWHV